MSTKSRARDAADPHDSDRAWPAPETGLLDGFVNGAAALLPAIAEIDILPETARP